VSVPHVPFSFVAALFIALITGCATPGTPAMAETPTDPVSAQVRTEVNMENNQIQDLSIDDVQDGRLKAWLTDFKKSFPETDRFYITELDDCFEITVSHNSANGYSGGAEAYRVDKVSGEVRMIWHEHPMRLPDEDEHPESP
jgi:hypothetical protein